MCLICLVNNFMVNIYIKDKLVESGQYIICAVSRLMQISYLTIHVVLYSCCVVPYLCCIVVL